MPFLAVCGFDIRANRPCFLTKQERQNEAISNLIEGLRLDTDNQEVIEQYPELGVSVESRPQGVNLCHLFQDKVGLRSESALFSSPFPILPTNARWPKR